jgi:3-oxoadipate enol-lactonase
MQKGFLKHNNGKIFYQVKGDGEAIVFIHGFTLDHRMWNEQVEYFSTNFKAVTYDERGFGKSSLPKAKYSDQGDLQALLKSLKIEQTHVVGLSFGGEIAIDFTLEFPDSVKTLTLLDSSLGGYKSTVDWNVKAEEEGIERAKENWANHPVFEKTRSSKCWPEVQKIVNTYSGWHWLNRDPRKKLDPSAKERLQEIKVPTLIIVGEDDLDYFHDIARYIHKRVKSSTLAFVEDAGHMVNMEKPEEVNRLIEKYITS